MSYLFFPILYTKWWMLVLYKERWRSFILEMLMRTFHVPSAVMTIDSVVKKKNQSYLFSLKTLSQCQLILAVSCQWAIVPWFCLPATTSVVKPLAQGIYQSHKVRHKIMCKMYMDFSGEKLLGCGRMLASDNVNVLCSI